MGGKIFSNKIWQLSDLECKTLSNQIVLHPFVITDTYIYYIYVIQGGWLTFNSIYVVDFVQGQRYDESK